MANPLASLRWEVLRQEGKMPVLDLERQVCVPTQVGDMAGREFQEGEQSKQRQEAWLILRKEIRLGCGTCRRWCAGLLGDLGTSCFPDFGTVSICTMRGSDWVILGGLSSSPLWLLLEAVSLPSPMYSSRE